MTRVSTDDRLTVGDALTVAVKLEVLAGLAGPTRGGVFRAALAEFHSLMSNAIAMDLQEEADEAVGPPCSANRVARIEFYRDYSAGISGPLGWRATRVVSEFCIPAD